jgi:hypothetical protein
VPINTPVQCPHRGRLTKLLPSHDKLCKYSFRFPVGSTCPGEKVPTECYYDKVIIRKIHEDISRDSILDHSSHVEADLILLLTHRGMHVFLQHISVRWIYVSYARVQHANFCDAKFMYRCKHLYVLCLVAWLSGDWSREQILVHSNLVHAMQVVGIWFHGTS